MDAVSLNHGALFGKPCYNYTILYELCFLLIIHTVQTQLYQHSAQLHIYR
jgi:hypothetical protein